MHVGSNLSTPYSYFHNPSSGTYHFDTDTNVEFTVYFALDSSWFPLLPQLYDDDDKQASRRRKFNGWYLLQHNSGVVKLDKDVVFDGKIKHTSILMHAENSFFSVVSEAYLSADPDVTGKILN